ncbi:gamma-glutamyltranspeptidase [Bradyrhizobium sp. USDA 4509]
MQNPTARARWMVAALVSIGIMSAAPGRAASVAPAAAENGMVVSAQHLATQVGVEVLKRGGNAVDAAVAVGYALAVAYPAAGNLGGGGFMTIQFADGRKTFLDFRETAPKGATADMYLDKDGKVIPGLSTKGHLAVGVPGSVAGMEYAREKYGTMKRADVIAPALQLAEDGFVLDQGDVSMLQASTKDFQDDPASAAIFLNNGKPFQVGERLTQHELAETLREISKRGSDGFYKGWVGAAIVAASQAGKGLLTQEDLDNYRVRELAPVECDYRGYHVVSAPPPSSGGVVICEMLNILEGYRLKGARLPLGAGGALPDRGDAPRLRRSQQLSRRSGLREESARAPARQDLRREDPCRDRPGQGRSVQGHQARRSAA